MCIIVCYECVPTVRPRASEVSGWNDHQLNIQKQKLAENMSSSTSFWKELKKVSPANKVTTHVMDNAHGDRNVMELLLTKYKTLYNSVPTSDDELQHLNCIIDNGISDFKEQGMFSTPDLIHKSILQFKKSKDDGNVGFKSDHLINGGHCLHVFLYILFNVMITHGYNARDLRISSMLSIPKDMKSSLTSSDNYRGISLFNSICKVFDYTILDLCNDYFMISDMQFGLKNKHSTIMCSLAYYEVINHYLCNHSNVCSCLLDASKAFDRVHYGKLFNILLYKKVPFVIIRLLLDAYIRQEARVIWNSCKSHYFRVNNNNIYLKSNIQCT